jgi:hypothetical protein
MNGLIYGIKLTENLSVAVKLVKRRHPNLVNSK